MREIQAMEKVKDVVEVNTRVDALAKEVDIFKIILLKCDTLQGITPFLEIPSVHTTGLIPMLLETV